ncbi:hypothetical protein WR25_24425 [Diploscapter pachys]|uniref:Uncharacterized protein n=1 Tax=Diploscapter pachys TaxID=2018661 RepID=A0A2A2LJ79_9BILA|nr:hypothetical protein WR25_24425 [Diploscapter pachys]
MYPSSSGAGHNPNPPRRGVNAALEPVQEWTIKEILFDGVEKRIKPDTFPDHIARMARQIDWMSLIDTDKRYDNPDLADLDDEEEYPKFEEELPTIPPEAGPWHTVAKNLHESLQQLNVLIDTIGIIRNTDYMKPLTVLDPLLIDSPTLIDFANQSKSSHWVWKRRALNEAIEVLGVSMRNRNPKEESTDEAHALRVSELMALRNVWRIRKTGHRIYGDLGYHIFGMKYNSRELFEIRRRDLSIEEMDAFRGRNPPSLIQVSVPRDLMKRSNLVLKIVRDEDSGGLFGKTVEEDYEYMKVRPKEAEKVHWRRALRWAQQALVNRDVFEQLCTDASRMYNRNSVVKGNTLMHAMYDGLFLKVELKNYPFKVGDLREPESDVFLARMLQQLVVTDECTRWIRPQMFVSMPLTTLPEQLDTRGSKAYTKVDIIEYARKQTRLLDKMGRITGHYYMAQKVNAILLDFQNSSSDPSIQWRFVRTSIYSSFASVNIIYRGYESLMGRHCFWVHIEHDGASVITKEGQTIDCYRDKEFLQFMIKMQIVNANVTAATFLGKFTWHYSVITTNMNAMSDRKLPCPSALLCNEPSTKQIFMQFPVDRSPIIKMRKFPFTPEEELDEDHQFTTFEFSRLPGTTLCKKMEFIFSLFKN